MNSLINFNGSLIDSQTPIATVYNRSLRFGDGIFETMFWDGTKIINLEYHLDRLFHGLDVLGFDSGESFTRVSITGEIIRLCEQNSSQTKARVRLNVFRKGGAVLFPTDNHPVFVAETAEFPKPDAQSIRMVLYEEEQKPMGVLANLKTNNFLLYLLALQYARRYGFDDAVILNSNKNICEASSSNLFAIKKGILYTPALSEGCVAGTKRRELLTILPSLGMECKEVALSVAKLMSMDELFLINSIRGIRTVSQLGENVFGSKITDTLKREVNKVYE